MFPRTLTASVYCSTESVRWDTQDEVKICARTFEIRGGTSLAGRRPLSIEGLGHAFKRSYRIDLY
jgi:hypothetical protein